MIKKIVLRALPTVVGTMFTVLFALNVLRIAARTLWGVSWHWVPDLSRFLFVWIVFLGTATVYAARDHLVMDFIVVKFSAAFRRKLDWCVEILMLAFLAMLVHQGWVVAMVRMRTPFDMWDFPTGYAYLALPAAAAVMFLLTVENLFSKNKTSENTYKEVS